MTETINAAGHWILRNSLEGSVLIVMLAAGAIFGRRWLSPKWQALLWALAGLRLVLPVAPSSSFSLFNLLPSITVDLPAEPLVREYAFAPSSAAATSPVEGTVELVPIAPTTFDWSLVLGAAWALGVVLILSLAVIRQVRVARRVHLLPEPSDTELLQIYDDCLSLAGLSHSKIRLAESPHAGDDRRVRCA